MNYQLSTNMVADMLTRIRNALMRGKTTVDIPCSKVKIGIAKVLKDQGYIRDYKVQKDKKLRGGPQGILQIIFKDVPVLTHLEVVSKSSRRVYRGYKDIPMVLDGLGIAILSTPKGILSDKQSKERKLGGEVLAYIW